MSVGDYKKNFCGEQWFKINADRVYKVESKYQCKPVQWNSEIINK